MENILKHKHEQLQKELTKMNITCLKGLNIAGMEEVV